MSVYSTHYHISHTYTILYLFHRHLFLHKVSLNIHYFQYCIIHGCCCTNICPNVNIHADCLQFGEMATLHIGIVVANCQIFRACMNVCSFSCLYIQTVDAFFHF